MNLIHFNHNWNLKLAQNIFTTIRRYDDKKFDYYKSQENTDFTVYLNGVLVGRAILLQIEKQIFNTLPKGLICSDTGLEYREALKIFKKFGIDKNTIVIILTFKKYEN